MPTNNGVPDIMFCALFEMYYLRSSNKLVKLPEESAKKFYGIRFIGTPNYHGNYPEKIKTIKEPVLFVSLENFCNAVDAKRKLCQLKISDTFMRLSIQCIVIAKK
jgi:hypothetical protein